MTQVIVGILFLVLTIGAIYWFQWFFMAEFPRLHHLLLGIFAAYAFALLIYVSVWVTERYAHDAKVAAQWFLNAIFFTPLLG